MRSKRVEVAIEIELVAYFVLAPIDPSIGYVSPHFELEVTLDVLFERNVLELAQVGVGLEAFVTAAFRYGLRVRVLICEHRAEEFLLAGLPAAAPLTDKPLDATPRRVPVA